MTTPTGQPERDHAALLAEKCKRHSAKYLGCLGSQEWADEACQLLSDAHAALTSPPAERAPSEGICGNCGGTAFEVVPVVDGGEEERCLTCGEAERVGRSAPAPAPAPITRETADEAAAEDAAWLAWQGKDADLPRIARETADAKAMIQVAKARLLRPATCRCDGEYHDSCGDRALIERLLSALQQVTGR